MRNLVRSLSSGLLVLLAASTAQAAPITVDFYTTGVFVGCDSQSVGSMSATCTEGTATLTYDFAGTAALPFSVSLTDAVPSAGVNYGGFTMSGGTAGLTPFAGISFTMTLNQIAPSAGSQAVVGSISGAVGHQAGILLWAPVSPQSWDIGLVHWTIAIDASGPAAGGVLINPPGAGGAAGERQALTGTASMDPTTGPPTTPVPEPASLLLLGAGLGGMFVRRRRR